MKKAIDQTVRDLKRGVNKKVLKVPGIEQKILDATSNEPWGPHGSILADIAQATRNYHEYQMIMHVIWKRLNDTGKNWRHVHKALTVLEYLVGHGLERVIDDIREHAYQISTLSDFQYIDSGGKDQGSTVRRKSQSLIALVNDREKIQEVREKAFSNRDTYHSTYAPGGRSSYSGGGGGYSDRHDDDRKEGRYRDSYEGRYRAEDQNGYGRERDWGARDDEKYGRGGDSSNRDGDRYGRVSDERYGSDSYRDDDYRGSHSNDDSQYGARRRSLDRDKDRFSEEDDRYSSRGSGGGVDEPSQDERRLERKFSEQSPHPSYEAAVKNAHDHVQDGRDVVNVAPYATKTSSPPEAKISFPVSTSQDHNQSTAGVSPLATKKETNEFDEFDTRESAPAVTAPASFGGVDLFANQSASDPIHPLALAPVSYGATSEADGLVNPGIGTNFVPQSSASTAFNEHSEDPFGHGQFRATTQAHSQAQQHGSAPATSFLPSSGTVQGAETPARAAPKVEPTSVFDLGDPLSGLTYTPTIANGHQQFAVNPPSIGSEFPRAHANNGVFCAVPPSGPAGSVAPQQPEQRAHTSNMNYPLQSAGSAHPAAGQPARAPSPKDKFETKSTVWADTLNRGLVNLNISGAKVNSMADIGVDFEAINRMDKRKERSSATPASSTITMGKAMGSGSGIGRAGVGAVAPPVDPVTGSGMGMGMGAHGGGMNQPMGMGMLMNRPTGMGLYQGAQMRPPAQGPGVGYNPMTGTSMGGYGAQQPYGGGHR